MKKLYCYVDETGQDTNGRLFLVAAVIVAGDRDQLRTTLDAIERLPGKDRKWAKSKAAQKQSYLQLLIQQRPELTNYYAYYQNTTKYFACTTETVIRAVAMAVDRESYRVTVLVDGLNKKGQHQLGATLRRSGLAVHKIRGLRDESDEFLRLSGAIAGFVRDYREQQPYASRLYGEAVARGRIVEL